MTDDKYYTISVNFSDGTEEPEFDMNYSDKCDCVMCTMIMQSTWVSVKDRLPEEGLKVLAYDCEDDIESIKIDYVVSFGTNEWVWACRLVDDYAQVTHWMPLPKPPKLDDYTSPPPLDSYPAKIKIL